MPWHDPSLSIRWGAYAKLDADEQQKLVSLAVQAKEKGIATTRMAVEKVAGVFGIENVASVLTAIEDEAKKNAEKAVENAAAMTVATTLDAPKKDPPKPAKDTE